MPFDIGFDLGPISLGYSDRELPDPIYSFGFGGSSSSGFSSSSGQQSSYSRTDRTVYPDKIWPAQQQAYERLFGQAEGLGGMATSGFQDLYTQAANQAFQLMQPQQENPAISAYANQLGRALEQRILPTIRSDAVGTGNLGGSRQGIAEGLAVSNIAQQLQDFSGQQYQADQANRLAALSQIPQLGAFGLGIPWANLESMARIYGQPVVLDQGSKTTSVSVSQGTSRSAGGETSSSYREQASGPDRDWVLNPRGNQSGGGSAPSGGSAGTGFWNDVGTWRFGGGR